MSFDQVAYDVFLQIKTGETNDTIQYLEDLRWDVNRTINGLRWTALHLAAYQGDHQLIEYLVCRGADVHALNQSGYTPLKLAEYKGFSNLNGLLSTESHFEEGVVGSSA